MKLKTPLAAAASLVFDAVTASTSQSSGMANSTAVFNPVSAQCNASTVFFPVTYTYTASVTVLPSECTTSKAGPPFNTNSVTLVITQTTTSTVYSTATLTVISTAYPAVDVSSTIRPYMFTADSSTTSWLEGNSPSSGASLVTATTTIPVSSADLSPVGVSPSTTITLHSTLTNLITVIPPVATSTLFSLTSPDSTSTTYITHTTTISSLTTITRSSFTGAGSWGWNLTSSTTSGAGEGGGTAAAVGTPTTGTVTYYWASGNQTYSTSTTVLTTTFPALVQSAITIFLDPTTITRSVSQVTTASYTTVVPSLSLSAPSNSISGAQTASSKLPTLGLGSTGGSLTLPTTSGAAGPVSPFTSGSTDVSSSSSADDASSASAPRSDSMLATPSTAPGLPNESLSSTPSIDSSSSYTATPNNSTNPSKTETGSQSISATILPTGMSSSSAEANGPNSSASFNSVADSSSGGHVNSTSTTTYGYGDPSVSAASTAVSSELTTTASLDTISSSIQTLSSLSSSFTNGQLSTISPGPFNSTTSSTDATSSIGTSFAKTSVTTSPFSISPTMTLSSGFPTISGTKVSLTGSTTSVSASATPSVCGEHGDFVLNFDDLPKFSPSNANQTDITQAPPIFSPYHHLTFSDGYVHTPPPNAPYQPRSGTQMAVFLGNGSSNASSEQSAMSATSNVGRIQPGEISDGPYDSLSAFWFNAHSAWVGCDNAGPDPCNFNVTGWIWDPSSQAEIAAYNTQYKLPPCPGFQNCQLQQIVFPASFQALSGLQVQAFVGQEQRMFFMDDLALGWYNNTCVAGMQRMGRPGNFGGGSRNFVAERMRSVRRFVR